MKKLFASLLLLFALPAFSDQQVDTGSTLLRTQFYTLRFKQNDLSDTAPIPVAGFCIVRFRQAGSDAVSLYSVPTETTPAASGTLISAFSASTVTPVSFDAGTFFVKAKPTTGTTGGSIMTLDCNPKLGSGGGVASGTFASRPASGASAPLYLVTDGATSVCAAGGGSSRCLQQWNGSSWVNVDATGSGIASVSADPTPLLGGNLDGGNRVITNLGNSTFEGTVALTPDPNTTAASSPTHVIQDNNKTWMNIDGEKSPNAIEDPPPRDFSILKTKAVGTERDHQCLTKTECFGQYNSTFGGGDTDVAGMENDVYGLGGAKVYGDEGMQNYRSFLSDNYLTAFLRVPGGLASGAGTQTVAVDLNSETESRVVGEGQLAVFTGSQVLTTIVDVPPGVFINGALDAGDAAWSFDGSASGQGVWSIGNGEVVSSGVQSTGWCFSAQDSDYLDVNSQTSNIWLRITAVDSAANPDTITTEWLNQGYNGKTPYPYLATEAASEGRVAPCAELGIPTFNAGNDYVSDQLTFIKGAGFPVIGANALFQVSAYPNIRMTGVNMVFANELGGMYSHDAVKAVNALDGSATSGRYQLGALVTGEAYTNGVDLTTILKDGNRHGWNWGLLCPVEGCEVGFRYRYTADASDVNFSQWAMQFDWSSEDWSDDLPRIVARIENDSTKNLTLDATDGWGANGDRFAKLSDFPGGFGDINTIGDCTGGSAFTGPCGTNLKSNSNFIVDLDNDANDVNASFSIRGNGGATNAFVVTEGGSLTLAGSIDSLNGLFYQTLESGEDSTTAGAIRLWGGASNATITTIRPPTTGIASTFRLPPSTSIGANKFLQTDASGNTTWATIAGTGDVVGPASSTTNGIPRYLDTGGKNIINSGVTIDGSNNVDLANGTLAAGVNIETASSTPYTLTTAKGQWVFVTNAATTTINLPALGAVSGRSVCVFVDVSQQVYLDPNASETIYLNGANLGGGVRLASAAAGSALGNFTCLLSNGSKWTVLANSGPWVTAGS